MGRESENSAGGDCAQGVSAATRSPPRRGADDCAGAPLAGLDRTDSGRKRFGFWRFESRVGWLRSVTKTEQLSNLGPTVPLRSRIPPLYSQASGRISGERFPPIQSALLREKRGSLCRSR